MSGYDIETQTLQHPRKHPLLLFFKRHILEKTAGERTVERDLTPEEFATLVEAICKPMRYGPSFCCWKRSWATKARNTNNMLAALYRYHAAVLAPSSPICTKESRAARLGFFLRTGGKKVAAQQGTPLLEGHLFGTLFELTSKEEIEQLRNEGYPSLLEVPHKMKRQSTSPNEKTEAKVYAVCGPLSLVSHYYRAPLRFTLPRSMMPREEGKEFHGLQAIYAQPVAERGFCGTKRRTLGDLFWLDFISGGVADVRFVRETKLGCDIIFFFNMRQE